MKIELPETLIDPLDTLLKAWRFFHYGDEIRQAPEVAVMPDSDTFADDSDHDARKWKKQKGEEVDGLIWDLARSRSELAWAIRRRWGIATYELPRFRWQDLYPEAKADLRERCKKRRLL